MLMAAEHHIERIFPASFLKKMYLYMDNPTLEEFSIALKYNLL